MLVSMFPCFFFPLHELLLGCNPFFFLAARTTNPVQQAVLWFRHRKGIKVLPPQTKTVEIKTWRLVLIKYQACRTRYQGFVSLLGAP